MTSKAKLGGNSGVSRIREKARDLSHDAQMLGAATRVAAAETVENLRTTAADYYEKGRERVTDLGHTVEDQIRRHPITSLLIASGIGFVIGYLASRR
jgi:ElaB/YqjD/DUF883 family membrane-anchored ribosome-binding protein